MLSDDPSTPIRILGINEAGYESGNALVTDLGDIPWLQDVASSDVWTAWDVRYRDVVVLDADNHPVAVFNLTDHDLARPADYEALKALLLDLVE